MMKKTIIIISICLISACSTTHYKGDGVILSEKKINSQSYKPHEGTTTGALIGGTAGVISGAAVGSVFGLIIGAFTTTSTLGIAGIILGSSAIGAMVVGTAGSAVGGGTGYIIDVLNHPAAYQYTIKPNYQSDAITITQNAPPIPVHTKVRILEKNHSLFIIK